MRVPQLTQAQIEARYDLQQRGSAVLTVCSAIGYLNTTREDRGRQAFICATMLLRDGMYNALDGRATGREFRTVRHATVRVPVAEADRRCQKCGFERPIRFEHCWEHQRTIPKE